MAVRTWIRKLFAPKTRTIRKDLFRFQPHLEALEDRTLLSNPATTGDLITAIQNANTAGGATTITLASHTTFNFTSADNSTNGANALPVIKANITIVGNGDTIARTGTNVFRLFDVASGGSLTLENVTLTGGLAKGTGVAAQGGAIYSSGTLKLSGVTVASNTAQGNNGVSGTNGNGGSGGNGGPGTGGGLGVAGNSVRLVNDTLSGNNASGSSGGSGGSGGAGFGGGMYVAGDVVTLNSDTFNSNFAYGGTGVTGGFGIEAGSGGAGGAGSGGGIYVAAGTVTLSDDTLSGNKAIGRMGGNGGGSSAIAGGSGGAGGAGSGGGVDVARGTVTLINDTLSGNYATGGNGGHGASGGTPAITSANGTHYSGGSGGNGGGGGSSTGGGLYILSGSKTILANTLIAVNTVTAGMGGGGGKGGANGSYTAPSGKSGSSGSTSAPDVSGTVASSDYDLIGDGSDSNLTDGTDSDQVGTSSSPINPLLGLLQNNGGLTQTMALLTGSPAIDAGDTNAAPSATDQRGYARIVGYDIDIGAYEYGATAATTDVSISGNAPTSVTPGGQITYTLTLSNNSSSAQSNITLADVLPAKTTLVSINGNAGSSSGTVSFWIDSLPAYTSYIFTLVIQVNSSMALGTIITNTASVGPITGDPNPSNNSVSFSTTVQDVPKVSVTDASGTYNGNPFSASATAMGVDGTTPVSGNFSYDYYDNTTSTDLGSTAPTNAGTYTVVATFTSSDSNYSSGGTAQTTFTISKGKLAVSSTADDGSLGTLRYAINQANAGNLTEIDFAIGAVDSAQTIHLTSALPTLTATGVFINGLSQGGSGNTKRLITLDGTGAGSSSDGLILQGSNWIVSGLILSNFSANGIEVEGSNNTIGGMAAGVGNVISGNQNDGLLIDSSASGVQVQGNSIGTNAAGTSALASAVGIEDAGNHNTIGGSVAGARNVISGNTTDGILLDSSATAETVQGNYIGLNYSGKAALANGSNGVEVQGSNNTIGGNSGSNYYTRNFLSGNSDDGVLIDSGATGNQVQGNFIGLDTSGTKGAANAANGIEIAGNKNTIGGTTFGLGNAISGNADDGILIDSTAVSNAVQGNDIGTDYSGRSVVAVANSGHGIEVLGSGTSIGGTFSTARNVISGNSKDGVILDSGASGTSIQGNYIGITLSSAALANAANGIEIASTSNTIGGTVSAARNIVSGNSNDSLLLDSSASNNQLLGNYIGTNVAGTAAMANKVGMEAAGTQNTIGGTTSGSRNIISGNSSDGLLIDSTASSDTVLGNFVDLNVYGNALGNSSNGIEIKGTANTLGGTAAAARNVISANSNDGVLLDSTASGNQLLGNYIGTDNHGAAAVANKVGIEDAGNHNTIGGSVLGARNVLSGNSGDGMLIDSTATAETVQSNFFGLNASGNAALANGSNGLEIQGSNNTIGGAAVYFARNFFSGNGNDGVLIDSGGAGNLVQGSFIGIDVSGTHAVGNGANGLEIAGSGNTIGGLTASDGSIVNQVISANSKDGVLIDSNATGNLVQGNYVGTNYAGTSAIANSVGSEVQGNSNTLGGATANVFNVISGNSTGGILIASGVSGTLVQGNYIGTDYTGASAVGNGSYGVNISGSNNTIGGSVSGAGNTIADNASGGVLVSSGAGDTISQNSIFANGATPTGPGISLSNGGNNSLVAPSLTKANVTGGNMLTVNFDFAAPTAKVSYVLEFFASASGDPEGKIYLGSLTVTPNNRNVRSYSFTTTATVTGTNPLITAMVTDASGDTSAFSNGVTMA